MTRFVIAAMALLASLSLAAAQGERCKVTDPTGTPLNVRASPNGKIIGTLANGSLVAIVEYKDADNGKSWVEDRGLPDEEAHRLGVPRVRLLLLTAAKAANSAGLAPDNPYSAAVARAPFHGSHAHLSRPCWTTSRPGP